MICLAIDPGKHTGWAIGSSSGTLQFDRAGEHKMPDPVRHGIWLHRARSWLDSMIDRHRIEVLALERQLVIRGNGSLVTLGLRGVMLELAWQRKLMVDEIQISTWQAWARKTLNWEKRPKRSSDDEHDAVAILLYWQEVRLPLVRGRGENALPVPA